MKGAKVTATSEKQHRLAMPGSEGHGVEQGAQAHDIRVSIAPNPSHLEAVDPVVMGLVRALQQRLGPSGQQRILGLLVHGDAAFAGLGIVPECLQLSNAPGRPAPTALAAPPAMSGSPSSKLQTLLSSSREGVTCRW